MTGSLYDWAHPRLEKTNKPLRRVSNGPEIGLVYDRPIRLSPSPSKHRHTTPDQKLCVCQQVSDLEAARLQREDLRDSLVAEVCSMSMHMSIPIATHVYTCAATQRGWAVSLHAVIPSGNGHVYGIGSMSATYVYAHVYTPASTHGCTFRPAGRSARHANG